MMGARRGPAAGRPTQQRMYVYISKNVLLFTPPPPSHSIMKITFDADLLSVSELYLYISLQ